MPLKYTESSASLDRQDAFKFTKTLVDTSVIIGSSNGLDNDAQIEDKEHEEDLQPKK
ncbi:44692_t:CDS:2 [Gigaspora margarita]|uniref:44692_t:CDS:1 n=1 Tax=Gigaspora margarita TaxID=4874 RepID=A0ABN7UW14_GIGMA|nr:44692_t:CDS:2 [Gigaspora margarita]